MIYGVDCSNYSGELTPDVAAKMKSDGYEFLIPGTQQFQDGRGYTQQQLDAARAAGLDTPSVYCFLYWDDRDTARLEYAKSFGLPVWVDCEWDIGGQTHDRILARIQAAIDFLGPKCAGIYTGRWWWQPNTGDSTRFANLPLWHAAYYPPGQLPNFDDFQPYGGWTRPYIWQYAGTVSPSGFNVDLNAIEGVPAIEPEHPVIMGDAALRMLGETLHSGAYGEASATWDPRGYYVVRVPNPDNSDVDPVIEVAIR